ncbi:MAG: amidohydrolase family protein, partial [Thermoanaerobaculia bacterium]
AYTVKRYPEELTSYMRRHGRSKVLFGSNWPMISPAKALAGLDELGLDDEARHLFLAGNASRVFGLS